MADAICCPTEPQLPRFFAGKEVFITGATGFVGKVLLVRLLWTCPEVSRLHLLIQHKRGADPRERLACLKDSPVFDEIRAHCPHQLDKLVAVPGDMRAPLLGLDADAVAELNQVSVVLNNAAITKFWEPLEEVLTLNTLSVIKVMDLCDKLPALQALVHVSTAFCEGERPHVAERVAEPREALPRVLRQLQSAAPGDLRRETARLIQPKFNTYIFSKALAEACVAERTQRKYSAAIFRPSIVTSTYRAPFPGWIEGISGPIGVLVGTAQGVFRVFYYQGDGKADLVPVDLVADSMLAVAWETATDRSCDLRVYYCGSQEQPLLWDQFYNEMIYNAVNYPMDNVFYYPFLLNVKHRYVHKVLEVLMQTAPLYVAEYLCRLCGIKTGRSYITIAKRLSNMSIVLRDFSCRDFSFSADNMRRLRERLHHTDGHLFYLDIRYVDWKDYMSNFHRGVKKYILRQSDESLPRAITHMNRLRVINSIVKLILSWLVYKYVLWVVHNFF